jgi:murein DD-endopeptidase MepM/ murein hydrolase activator NlpD
MERFHFNPETLSYQKITVTGKQKACRFFLFTGLTALFATGLLILRDFRAVTPRTERLEVEQERIVYGMELLNRDMTQYEQCLENVAYNDDYIYRVYFEQEPWPATLREAGVGGSQEYDFPGNQKYRNLVARTHNNIERVERKLVLQSTSFDEVIGMAATKEERLAARPAIQPVSLNDLIHFGSSFGLRFHPILNYWRPHEGIDLTAPLGTPIYATADGTVIQAGFSMGGFGKRILVDHGFGYNTLYGHCQEILVEPGQAVKRGEVIGRVGSTGLSRSPHLHYEVHVNGRPVDPMNYYANDLSPEEYDRMIGMLSEADASFDIN